MNLQGRFLLFLTLPGLSLAAAELDLRSFGARGDGRSNDTGSFNNAVAALKRAEPGSTLKIPAGTYLIGRQSWTGLNGNTIAGEPGAVILLDDIRTSSIEIGECRKLTVKNLTFRHRQPSSMNGKVVERPDRKALIVEAPGLDVFGVEGMRTMMHIFSPEGKMDHRFHRADVRKIEPLGNNRFRIEFDQPIENDAVIGQTVVFFLRGGRPVLMTLRSRQGVYENLHIVNGGDLAFGLRYCEEMTFRNCKIGPDAGSGLFMSTGADGIHSKHARRGHLVENCDFSGMSDDDINFSTTYQNVASADGDSAVLVGDNRDYRVGDRVAVFDPEHCAITQQLNVTAVSPAKWKNFDAIQVTFSEPLKVSETLDSMGRDKPFSLLFGHKGALPGLVFNLEAAHAGTVIRNNRFGNNRARGVLLRTADTVIENNIFHNLRGPAILYASEGMWLECGRIENVTIRNNRFEEVSRSPVLFSTISYRSKREAGDHWNRNLAITGNTFLNCGAPAVEGGDTFGLCGNLILLENTSQAKVSGNTFGPLAPDAKKYDPVIVNNSDNVSVSGNHQK